MVIKMKHNLLIIGGGGHGKVAGEIASLMLRWDTIQYLDDNPKLQSFMGFEVIGKTSDAIQYIKDYDLFIAIGNNQYRKEKIRDLEEMNASIPALIHPNSIISSHSKVGIGSIIMAGAIINCCSNIGKGCIINTGATLDHDNDIEDYVHISPGVHIAGTVHIGEGSWIGIGSTIIHNITITSGCIIGAGAVVIHDITKPGTYMGVPAKRMEV